MFLVVVALILPYQLRHTPANDDRPTLKKPIFTYYYINISLMIDLYYYYYTIKFQSTPQSDTTNTHHHYNTKKEGLPGAAIRRTPDTARIPSQTKKTTAPIQSEATKKEA